MKGKRELILNTMQQLFLEGTAGTASVSDIAKRAGISKGGLYYYFDSKEAVLDALVNREYENIIKNCKNVLTSFNGNAIEKINLLFSTYKSSYVDPSLDKYLHMPQNAALHQKSLAIILKELSLLITPIIEEGITEKLFQTDYPKEVAEIILSTFTFLYDPGIFLWTPEDMYNKLRALADVMECSLRAPHGSFSFLFESSY